MSEDDTLSLRVDDAMQERGELRGSAFVAIVVMVVVLVVVALRMIMRQEDPRCNYLFMSLKLQEYQLIEV